MLEDPNNVEKQTTCTAAQAQVNEYVAVCSLCALLQCS